MKLNAEQIIKALECCNAYTHGSPCEECPYNNDVVLADNEICSNRMALDALSLINELTEEIELWKGCSNHSDKLLSQNLAALDENIDEKIDMFANKLKAKMTGEVFTNKGKEKYGRFYESDIDKIAAEVKVE